MSFSIARGEIFGFLGPNGGGKTTLFKLLSTLVPIQSGSARLLGHDLAAKPARSAAGSASCFSIRASTAS